MTDRKQNPGARRRSYRELQADAQLPPRPALPGGMAKRDRHAQQVRRRQLARPWDRVTEAVAEVLGDGSDMFAIWIEHCRLEDASATTLFVSVPATRLWAIARYRTLLTNAATALAGRPLEVELFDVAALADTGDASPRALGDA